MRRIAALELPTLAKDFARVLRHYQHRRHAKPMWHGKVAREVLEHGGPAGIDVVQSQKAVIGRWGRFGLQLGGDYIKHIVKVVIEVAPREHRVGVAPGAVGQDPLAASKWCNRGAQPDIGLER